jgi:alpha-tubulin suppressor-like RCC1 family protein
LLLWTTVDRHAPIKVVGLEGVHVARVACGWRHSAAVTDNGRVFAWGWSKYGQLGLGDHK